MDTFECPVCKAEHDIGDYPDHLRDMTNNRFKFDCECGAQFECSVDWCPDITVDEGSAKVNVNPLREASARAAALAVEKEHSSLQVVQKLGFPSVEAFIDKAWPNYLPQADAVIAIARDDALEAAAREAEGEAADECDCSQCAMARSIATSIRALKDKQP